MDKIIPEDKQRIADFVAEGIEISQPRVRKEKDPFWTALTKAGTELWLDTGDIEAATALWSGDMSALTTNNTLLNKEIQKGIYDDLIAKANGVLSRYDLETRVVEIAFILNAHHGLRLVDTFGGKVSVELHTNLADDFDGIVDYGRRFHEICPSHFIIKVPLTAVGLYGARALRAEGIPVNFTLEFSARQNAVVTLVARPSYCNVFLGRLNSYVADNGLGTGDNIGERTTIASCNLVHEYSRANPEPTRQIAASLRNGAQLRSLAGVDVFTMPTAVAEDGRKNIEGPFSSRLDTHYETDLGPGVDPDEVRLSTLWDLSDAEKRFLDSLRKDLPKNGDLLIRRAHDLGCGDLFPVLSGSERKQIGDDGKIPVHATWKDRIAARELAVDTLLNAAGLATFTKDQQALDDRIRSIIAS